MRVLLSTYVARGEVEPLVGAAVDWGAEECHAAISTGDVNRSLAMTDRAVVIAGHVRRASCCLANWR